MNEDATVLPIKILVTLQPGVKINAPAWTGLVQQVAVKPGDTVATGTPVTVVDGITRLAAHTIVPFWRSIEAGMEGEDVGNLNELLGQLDLDTGYGEYASNATEQGIKELAAKLGAPPTTMFDPAWLVWIPEVSLQVGMISLAVNVPAPAAGTAILTTQPTILQAALVPAETSITAPVDASSDGGDGTAEEVAPPKPTEAGAKASTIATYHAPTGATVDINSTPVEITDERDQVAASSFPTLVPLAVESRLVEARVTIPATPGQVAVPPGAVFTSEPDTSCVIRVRDADQEVVIVDVLGGDYTHSFVTGDLKATDRVLVGVDAASRQCG